MIAVLANFVFSVLKAVDPEKFVVGRAYAATAASSVSSNSFSCASIIYGTVVVNFFKGYMKTMSAKTKSRVGSILKTITFVSRPLYGLAVIGLIMPFLIHAFPQHDFAFAAGFYAIIAITQLVCRQLVLGAMTIMSEEIGEFIRPYVNQSIEEQPSSIRELASVHQKLTATLKTTKTQSLPVTICNILFGFWPYLQRKSAYLSLAKMVLMGVQTIGWLHAIAPSNTMSPLRGVISSTFLSRFGATSRVHISRQSKRSLQETLGIHGCREVL